MAEGASAGVAHDTGDTAQGAGDAGSVAVTGRLADVDDERLCTGFAAVGSESATEAERLRSAVLRASDGAMICSAGATSPPVTSSQFSAIESAASGALHLTPSSMQSSSSLLHSTPSLSFHVDMSTTRSMAHIADARRALTGERGHGSFGEHLRAGSGKSSSSSSATDGR